MKSIENLIFARTFLASVFRSTIHHCKVSNSSKSIHEWRSRSASLQKKRFTLEEVEKGHSLLMDFVECIIICKRRSLFDIPITDLFRTFTISEQWTLHSNPIYKTTKVCLMRQFFSETAPPILMKLSIHFTHSLKMVLK